jgi:dTDP-4-amino-4,6-dideoxygalactose transaminase
VKYQSKWKVPRSRNHVTNRKIRDEIIKYVEPVIFEDNWEALRMVSEFEKAFSEKFNFSYVSGVQTCSAALFLSLLALGVKSGDEVITVANSDMATTAAISHCGATLVLCDVCESDYVIDISKVENLITEKTRAIVPVGGCSTSNSGKGLWRDCR